MSDDGSISIEMIQALRKSFSEDPTGKIVQNALTNGHLIDVALDRSLIQRTNATFSTKLDQWKAEDSLSERRSAHHDMHMRHVAPLMGRLDPLLGAMFLISGVKMCPKGGLQGCTRAVLI